MKAKYEQPILAGLFSILGVLTIIGGVIGAIVSFSASASVTEAIAITVAGIFAGILYIGLSQLVNYVAQTAHATDRLSEILETKITESLNSIQGCIPAAPFKVRIDTTPPIPSTRGEFYYAVDGVKKGPRTAAEIRRLWQEGIIQSETFVLREGETQWRKYGDILGAEKKNG